MFTLILESQPPFEKKFRILISDDHEKLTRAYSGQLPDEAFLTFWPQTLYVGNDETNCYYTCNNGNFIYLDCLKKIYRPAFFYFIFFRLMSSYLHGESTEILISGRNRENSSRSDFWTPAKLPEKCTSHSAQGHVSASANTLPGWSYD